MADEVIWRPLLLDALAVLALPPDEQVRVNGPGCVACDLLNDFDHARMVTLGDAPGLSDDQRRFLDRMEAVIEEMQQPDYECFDNEVVRRPRWQQLRELAAEALRSFGWEQPVVQPFREIEPGVWHRPRAEA